jgi:hypothetical protein
MRGYHSDGDKPKSKDKEKVDADAEYAAYTDEKELTCFPDPSPKQAERKSSPKPSTSEAPAEPPRPLDGQHFSREELSDFVITLCGDPKSIEIAPDVLMGVDLKDNRVGDTRAYKAIKQPVVLSEFAFISPEPYLPLVVQSFLWICRCSDKFDYANLKYVYLLLANIRWVLFFSLFFGSLLTYYAWAFKFAILLPVGGIVAFIGKNEYFWRRRTFVYVPHLLTQCVQKYTCLDPDPESVKQTMHQKLQNAFGELLLEDRVTLEYCDNTERLAVWHTVRRTRGNGLRRQAGFSLTYLPPLRPHSPGPSDSDPSGDGSDDSDDEDSKFEKSSHEDILLARAAWRELNPILTEARRSICEKTGPAREALISALSRTGESLTNFRLALIARTQRMCDKEFFEESLEKFRHLTRRLSHALEPSHSASASFICDHWRRGLISTSGCEACLARMHANLNWAERMKRITEEGRLAELRRKSSRFSSLNPTTSSNTPAPSIPDAIASKCGQDQLPRPSSPSSTDSPTS